MAGTRGMLRVFEDIGAASGAAALSIAEALAQAAGQHGQTTIVLAGGTTPGPLYQHLARLPAALIPWDRVHVFWGDERYVPHEHAASNYRFARQTLIDHVPVPPDHVHPMPTSHLDPDDAAATYERLLAGVFATAWPRFDVAMCGIGADGHTASLSPRAPEVEERTRWVAVARPPQAPSVRLSLTLPVFNHAGRVDVIVSGAEKAAALSRAIAGTEPPTECPAAGLDPVDGILTWWVDRAAAAAGVGT